MRSLGRIWMSKTKSGDADRITELLKDLLITELGRAGVPQPVIRKIVGCDMNRVSRIVKNSLGGNEDAGGDRGATS